MATNEERQTLAYLRQIGAILQAKSGSRDAVILLDRGSGNRDTGVLQNAVKYDRLIVSIYNLKATPKAATVEPTEEKTTPRAAKPKVTVKINGFLTDEETYQIASDTLEKEGQHTIELPFLTTKYQIVVEADESTEYAVFGL